MLIKGKTFIIPVDFYYVGDGRRQEIPIILGHIFLAIVGAVIYVKNGRLTLKVGE